MIIDFFLKTGSLISCAPNSHSFTSPYKAKMGRFLNKDHDKPILNAVAAGGCRIDVLGACSARGREFASSARMFLIVG
jgi:hypothetical protein